MACGSRSAPLSPKYWRAARSAADPSTGASRWTCTSNATSCCGWMADVLIHRRSGVGCGPAARDRGRRTADRRVPAALQHRLLIDRALVGDLGGIERGRLLEQNRMLDTR